MSKLSKKTFLSILQILDEFESNCGKRIIVLKVAFFVNEEFRHEIQKSAKNATSFSFS